MEVWNIHVDIVSIKQQQKEVLISTKKVQDAIKYLCGQCKRQAKQQKKDLISTKEQFTKLKSIPADNVSINQHQMEILHNTEE